MTRALGQLDPKLSWYSARAAGLVAWAIVTAAIVLGLALSSRSFRRRGVPAWMLDLHRFLGTLSLVFVVVHVAALVADNYVHFGWRETLVPMASRWRPGAVAWGIVATYLLLAVQITSWSMRHIPRRVWHHVHLSSFVLFVAATVHGFTAGADATSTAVRWAACTGIALVLFLTVFRLAVRRGDAGRSPLSRDAPRGHRRGGLTVEVRDAEPSRDRPFPRPRARRTRRRVPQPEGLRQRGVPPAA